MKIIGICIGVAFVFILGAIFAAPLLIMIIEYHGASACRAEYFSEERCINMSIKTTFVNPSRYLKDE
jgi:hypothetical protein